MRPQNDLILQGSSIGSITSLAQLSDGWVRCSFQVACLNGAVNGTFTVQGSNDVAVGAPPNQFLPTNWNNIGSSQQVIASFSAGQCTLVPWFDTCYRYHRVFYSAGNSGNTVGSFTVRCESKNL